MEKESNDRLKKETNVLTAEEKWLEYVCICVYNI